MEQYEDDESARARVLGNGQVLAFIAGYWKRRWPAFCVTAMLTLVSIGFESQMPRAAQRLVDIMILGPAQGHGAWAAWAYFVGVYVAFAVIRNVAIRIFWNPL